MITTDISPKEALEKYFGFKQFKGEQEEVIQSVLDGNDTFVIMPTGGGKSLCYQLPALMRPGTAIVVSPLIALMKNQVDAIRGFSEEDGVAHFLNSSLNKTETMRVRADITSGKTKLLYVAPESLTKEENVDFFKSVNISFVAIDEAHCISEWGHDFRPEYRRLKDIVMQISDVPIIALTATATPKVQQDIQKNLGMTNAKTFKASFNRPNLYYEVRPKKNMVKQIIQFIKQNQGKSGIIYCLSRKKTEELAEFLVVNGIKALPYHAGMDANHRSQVQDRFLMQDVDVIVATIAFGMGIDKPDVRFVIHHDIPKSLESYYQETGRAGRDGGEGHCIAFYSYKDIEKLEKFLQGKPLAEQEIGMLLLREVESYAETAMCRRKFLLHYFGEEFDEVNGEGAMMDDNMRFPKEKFNGKDQVELVLKAVKEFREGHKAKFYGDLLTGTKTAEVTTYKGQLSDLFGEGKDDGDDKYWIAIIRQCVVQGFLRKEIESYGTLKLTETGIQFLKNPQDVMLIKEADYSDVDSDDPVVSMKAGGGAADEQLFAMLRDLRKKVATEKKLPPYVIFQDPSLEEMATIYPITEDELTRINGVGRGKATKYGKPFLELIKKHVDENEIERPNDIHIKSIVNKSSLKVQIIQNLDKQLPLEDIAKGAGKTYDEIIEEIESIVESGTKLNIDYYLLDILDKDSIGEIYDYFMESQEGELKPAFKELTPDFTEEEIRLVRVKFLSEVAN